MVNDMLSLLQDLDRKVSRPDASQEEVDELFEWMKDNEQLDQLLREEIEAAPDHELSDSRKRHIYTTIVNSNGNGNAQPTPNATQPTTWRQRFTPMRLLAAACAVVAVCSVSMLAWQNLRPQPVYQPLMATTEAANRSQLTLPDGTHVYLNAQSHLSYQFDAKGRQRLVNLDGEGYFEVAPDKAHPFKILTNGLEVLCLGTKFDIKNYEDDSSAKVILRQGKVKVTSGTQEIVMQPGTCVTYNKATGRLSQQMVQKDYATDWMQGYAYYKSECLEDIANELSRNYGKRIVLSSPAMGRETFSGYLGHSSLDDVLRALSVAAGIRYEYINDSTIQLFNNQK
jgi:ferric-dicitrate binding protein FerR (iron transport regulator)